VRGEPGTKVTLTLKRASRTFDLTITRAKITQREVTSKMLDGKIGYIPLQQFNETATDELESASKRLIGEGAKGLIVDLRGNGGGYLDQSATVANLFLNKGQEISSVRGRGGDQQVFYATDQPAAPSVPLIVLTDGRTASASEIVAGALQDHDRALIVGTTSFGKGLVQTVYPLDGGYALKMTTAKWFTPSGRSIQKERKLLPDGEFVEVLPDSMETDSVRKSRPKFKSDAGRVVYGGGAVTPDVIVQPDTLTTAEQKLLTLLAPKAQVVRSTLVNYAVEHKNKVQPGFVVTKAWRDEFYDRLTKQGVKVDKPQFDAGSGEIDRLLGSSIARIAFGDSTEKRREVPEDAQLRRAVDLLRDPAIEAVVGARSMQQTIVIILGQDAPDVQRLIDTGLTGQAVLLWLFTVAMPKVADPGRPPLATGGDPIVVTASRWLQASGLAAPQPQQQKVAA